MSNNLKQNIKKYNKYNPIIINILIDKYGVSKQFITTSILGNRTSKTSLKIISDYIQIENDLKTYLTEKQT